MPFTKISKSVGEPSISRYDSRNDLGYGITKAKFHKPRPASSTYPYRTPGPFDQDTDWDDEDSQEQISKKMHQHQKSDPFSRKGTNPFYFAAGNTKLSDCFFRTEKVLEEIHSLSNSISPFPGSYKRRSNFGGGSRTSSGAVSSSSFKRTGSEKGYASAPPDINYDKSDNDSDEMIFNLEDLVKKLELETGNFRYRKT